MTQALFQIAVYLFALFALAGPVGWYVAKVYTGEITFLSRVEEMILRAAGTDARHEMGWKEYALAVISLSLGGFILLYVLLRAQGALPLNPEGAGAVAPHMAFNIAASFITNTDWQSYAPEKTLSHFSQTAGLAVQNFISAAVGLAVLVASIRGFTRKNTSKIGNFWADVTKGVIYILLPMSLLLAVFLGSQGVVQNFSAHVPATALEGGEMKIPGGPVASQVAIKQLGTNGGGFFNANSSHPFENPNYISNFAEALAILLIPVALCHAFGIMAGDRRQGWSLLLAMTVIFIPMLLLCCYFELQPIPEFPGAVNQEQGNMEGKEARFGAALSAIWAVATTSASNGSVNSMHDSFTPMGGMMPLFQMHFGEVIFGGVGSGLYGMLIFVIVTVFIAGLMVGRTPEYLGKKITVFEMKMASVAILVPPLVILAGTALAVMTEAGRAGALNPGAHGFSEILYAYSSAGSNNGSAFAGLNADSPFYSVTLGVVMLLARFWVIVPILAIAGSLASKNTVPVSSGTLVTYSPMFIMLLVMVVLMVGVLTFIPALAMGPMADALIAGAK